MLFTGFLRGEQKSFTGTLTDGYKKMLQGIYWVETKNRHWPFNGWGQKFSTGNLTGGDKNRHWTFNGWGQKALGGINGWGQKSFTGTLTGGDK